MQIIPIECKRDIFTLYNHCKGSAYFFLFYRRNIQCYYCFFDIDGIKIMWMRSKKRHFLGDNKYMYCTSTPQNRFVCLFVCLFVWSLSSHSRIFHSYGDVTIAGEGLQILIYARNLWPLSSEGSLTCHTCCDTGLPFIMVISEDP